MRRVFFKSLENGMDLYKIRKATSGSAGFDLVAAIDNDLTIESGKAELIPCGFSLQMPQGIEAQVRPRSGLALKNCVTVLNSPGTIDADYRGEICVILINHGTSKFIISRGMRIAQIVFAKLPQVELEESDELNKTERGSGGFGSTGV